MGWNFEKLYRQAFWVMSICFDLLRLCTVRAQCQKSRSSGQVMRAVRPCSTDIWPERLFSTVGLHRIHWQAVQHLPFLSLACNFSPHFLKEHIVLQSPPNTLNIWEHAWDGPFCQRQFVGALPMPKVPGCLHQVRAAAFHANRKQHTMRSLRPASSARSDTHLNRRRCGTMQEVLLLQHTPLLFVQVNLWKDTLGPGWSASAHKHCVT